MTAAETLFRILASPPAGDSGDRGVERGQRPTEGARPLTLSPDHPDWADVNAIRRGEHAAFERIFLAHYAALRDFARRLLSTEEDAADVAEEVFLRLWQGHSQFDVHTSIAAYLYAAVRHRVVDLLRRRRTELRLMTEWRPEAERQMNAELPGADAFVEHDELSGILRKAITMLPDRRRIALTLRWEAGLTNAEIATVLGIAPQSVANLLQRALSDLRAMLPDDLD